MKPNHHSGTQALIQSGRRPTGVETCGVCGLVHGAVSPCPPLLHSYRCYVQRREKLFTHHAVGRLDEASLSSIWADPEYVAFRGRVLDFDFSPCVDCGGCELAEGNLEDCFGNEHPVCGDCLWARGIIRCS